jgi:hypothetical protein
MSIQTHGLVLRQHQNPSQAAIEAVRQRKVDNPIDSAKRDSRLGSIPREADNATADAWRTGEARTVAGDAMANGAIVAPMFGPDTCIGVLAAEVRHGREQDESTRAVTMMVAAQLAMVLGAGPAPSTARAAEA